MKHKISLSLWAPACPLSQNWLSRRCLCAYSSTLVPRTALSQNLAKTQPSAFPSSQNLAKSLALWKKCPAKCTSKILPTYRNKHILQQDTRPQHSSLPLRRPYRYPRDRGASVQESYHLLSKRLYTSTSLHSWIFTRYTFVLRGRPRTLRPYALAILQGFTICGSAHGDLVGSAAMSYCHDRIVSARIVSPQNCFSDAEPHS